MLDWGACRRGATHLAGRTSASARFLRLKSDVLGASRAAVRAPEMQRAMTRAAYGLGAALAVVAALGVHAALNAAR
jgi:hypothetical protein